MHRGRHRDADDQRRDRHSRSPRRPTATATSGSTRLSRAVYTLLVEKDGYLAEKLGPVDATEIDVNVGDIAVWKAPGAKA